MEKATIVTVDGNEATTSVAHRVNEVMAIYPITPSSGMGEMSDEWSAKGQRNLWGQIPHVVEMQSEAGAVGAVHGSLQAGALTTTFTASQGLLLMIPSLYKIAGELTSYCMHVTARTLATHALSIFGDHSDVMACRQIGVALLASNSVQEAHDMALIGQASTLKSRIPFIHFFDGFRTSHEVSKIYKLSDDDLRYMIDEADVAAHKKRALTPDAPLLRGTAQNPDTFFQSREACNQFYDVCPEIVQKVMDRFAQRTGRQYNLFDYVGHPQAERIIIMMGSGAETAHETADYLTGQGEKVGLVKVRLYRPFSAQALLNVIPESVKAIAVLDRTKEPGAPGEPLYMDVQTAYVESDHAAKPVIVGGRYGLSCKDFTPAMVKAVFDNIAGSQPKNHFTVGIVDDVTHTSLPIDDEFDTESTDVVRAVFFGLGADGTVGANKNSIKIIGENTDNFAQGYFVYDSKKSGAMTISHLRFGPKEIHSTYLIKRAGFIACHQFVFLEKYDVLCYARKGATFLLNSPYTADEIWDKLPKQVQQTIIDKQIKFYVIDGYKVARNTGMGSRVNTIMQTCFFAISGVLPREEAIDQIKKAIQKTYGKKGEEIVKRNFAAVDATLANLHEVTIPANVTAVHDRLPMVPAHAPEFLQKVTAVMMAGDGDSLPVSAFPPDGTWPTATTQWEKRTIAQDVPIWNPDVCIQCNKCALVCPHAAIRAKVYDPKLLNNAPQTFRAADYKGKDFQGMKFTIQVAPQDCTGCGMCVSYCPAKDKANPKNKAINMQPLLELLEDEKANYAFFLDQVPAVEREKIENINVKGSQFFEPLFEYSGACAGCGETPYVKLATQLFGDRMLIANATGCSSIYGGNLPTTPYCKDKNGRGPTWSNSLFEDAAEFGLGMRLGVNSLQLHAREMLQQLASPVGEQLVQAILEADQSNEAGIRAQRARIEELKQRLATLNGQHTNQARQLDQIADYLVKKSVWSFGGDGWAFDIGYGGLDHVMSMQYDINILCLDTEVYSNTGGQASKATPLGAVAKFAASGKSLDKKDLGLMAMSYGHVYVASVAMGANDNHTDKAFLEAESYPGPSLIIAYSHCIAHGFDLRLGLEQQKRAVESGIWPLYRFDPRRVQAGQPPLILDSKPPKSTVTEYMSNETRFRMIEKMDPARFRKLAEAAQEATSRRVAIYQHMANLQVPNGSSQPAANTETATTA